MLTLPIKKKWFDMILSGEKKEEYRELTPYYRSRFRDLFIDEERLFLDKNVKKQVRFRNGYRADSPSFVATVTIDVGEGKKEWGAEAGRIYYILKIMEVKQTCNTTANQ